MQRSGATYLSAILIFGVCTFNAMAESTESLQLLQSSPEGIATRLLSAPPLFVPTDVGGRPFQSVNQTGAAMIGRAGEPGLPAQTCWILLPDRMSATLELRVTGETTLKNIDLAPIPTLSSDNPNFQPGKPYDRAAYARDEISPSAYATLSEPIEIGASRYTILTVTPYRYNPAQKTLYHAAEINADVRFKLDPAVSPTRAQNTPAWREVARALSDDPMRDELQPREDHLGHLVIVIPDNDQAAEAIEPLVEWKKRKGYIVTVARLNEGDVGNTREDIFGWLRDGWNNWEVPPTYVLMVGDSEGELTMPFWRDGENRQMSWYVSDNPYVLFEGNRAPDSWLPEAFIGRLPTATVSQLEQAVTKILAYEATPFHDSPWVEGAVLIADGVHSCIETNVSIREIMVANGYSRQDIHETLAEYFLDQHADHNIISAGVDNGVGFVNFRGFNNWGDYSTNEVYNRNNGMMMPVVTGMVCATCDFVNQQECIGEAWVKAFDGNQPNGAIACWGPSDLFTHTWFNNSLDAEFYHTLFNREVHTLGALTLASKLSLVRNYPSSMDMGNGTTVGYYLYTYTLLGDPSLQVWTREPRPITVDFEQQIPQGQTLLQFSVQDDDENPIPNAYVHVYRNDNVRFGGYTDASGELALSVPPLNNGTYSLTVTGPNLVPVMDDFEVAAVANYAALQQIEYDDDNADDSHGNADGLVNPGETIELIVTYTNTGENRLANLYGRLTTENPYVEIERDTVQFGEIQAGEEATAQQAFLITISPETPDREVVEFNLQAYNGNNQYLTSFTLTISGLRLQASDYYFADDELQPGDEGALVVAIVNTGDLDADTLSGTLYCLDPSIQIRRSETYFGDIAVGSSADNAAEPFQILAGQHAYLGSKIKFGLLLTDPNGLRDSLTFSVIVGQAVPEAPQGPDEYGYWAYDDRDESSGMAPEYERVTGATNLGINDQDDSDSPIGVGGQVRTIDLPFEFQFYGETFQRATISTNGWMAFAESNVIGWNNLELGSSYLPGGMIAPYWDDLWGGQVYTSYDQDNARFIIEWRGFQSEAGAVRVSVVLYDPTVVPTITGDGEILFEYIQLPEMRDTPNESVTIGICSPDRRIKLQIAHALDVDPRTSGLHSEMAVRFTTGIETEIGSLEGHVYNLTNNAPMEDVRIELEGTGNFTLSDAEGYYRMDGITAGTYIAIARVPYFNTARVENIVIRTGETSRTDLRLAHPTFNIDTDAINAIVLHDSSYQTAFHIWNDGNGPLEYRFNLDYEPGERDHPWDLLFDYNATEITGDNRLKGVVFLNGLFYLSGPDRAGSFPHKIYVLNKNGELVRSINQYTLDSTTSNGYLCLDVRDENLVAIEQGSVIEMSTAGEYISDTRTPYNPSYCVAWAPERGTYFTKSITGAEFLEVTPAGDVVHSWRSVEGVIYTAYGFAWFPEDPDGYSLYFARNLQDAVEYGTMMTIFKMNPDNGDFRFVQAIALQPGDRLLDIDITKEYNPLYWTLSMVVSGISTKRLVGVELGPNLSWISFEPDSASVAPGERQTIDLILRSMEMPAGRYDVVLQALHNAVGERYDIPITFSVSPEDAPDKQDPLPVDLRIESIFPNPFNGVARIGLELPRPSQAALMIYDLSGRELRNIPLGRLPAGRSSFSFDAEELPAGLYLAKLTAGGETRLAKLTLIK